MRTEPNYLYLVLGLITALILITAGSPVGVAGITGLVASTATLCVTAFMVAERRRLVALAITLGAVALSPVIWSRIYPAAFSMVMARWVYVADLLFWLFFTLVTTVIVFRGIVTARRVRANEIYGAIYVYILLGALFAQGYQLLLAFAPDALYFDPGRFGPPHELASGLRFRNAGDVVYYSFVTLGTVGYGDVTPASPAGRALSLVESVTGVMYVATMIARFVSIEAAGPRNADTA